VEQLLLVIKIIARFRKSAYLVEFKKQSCLIKNIFRGFWAWVACTLRLLLH